MKKNKYLLSLSLGLLSTTAVVGAFLVSSYTFADDSTVDEINITVPISCTMSGSGMTSHTASIANGTYNSNIGETTMTAFCNDNSGFAIYAIGYTDDTDGKNVLTDSVDTNNDIATGTATAPVGGNDNSNWAMKLSTITSPTPTYPITIQNNFDSFHNVPDDYALVAKRTQATDVGQQAEGSTIKSTYQAYISKTQPSGTYTGQVKYVMVHPSTELPPVGDNQIGVIYDGNGLFFDQAGTRSTNRVVYEESCEDEYGYVADTPAILKTDNLDYDGTQNGSYYRDYEVWLQGDDTYFEDAAKIKVEVYYKINFDTSFYFSDNGENGNFSCDDENGCEGTMSYVANGNQLGIYYDAYGETTLGYDYGIYAKVYPVYDEPIEGTSYGLVQENVCGFRPVNGAYVETMPWYGYWYIEDDDYINEFYYETVDEYDDDYYSIVKYLDENKDSFSGSNITVYAYNPYKILYDGNGATAGTMSGFYTELLFNTEKSNVDLMAYNFKKTGYGFAGWSANPNATVNGSDKIYGPNESISGDELTFDNNRETTLYAVWVPSSGNMQNFSCNSLSSGQVTALTDTRDNNVYTVGKMQDGNCWMMENLRLDAANSTDSTKAQGFGGVFTGLANSEDANFGGSSTAANSKYNTSDITGYNQVYRFPRYNNNNTNFGGTNSFGTTLITSPDDDNNHAQWYGYGNNYTWAAAMANTTDMTSSSASESANTSICPTGWQLPYGNYTGKGAASGGFSYLDVQMGGTGNTQRAPEVSNKWRSFPNNTIYAGHWNGSSDEGGKISVLRGFGGTYWSTSARSYHQAYFLHIDSDYVNPGSEVRTSYKNEANSVRCITGVSQT